MTKYFEVQHRDGAARIGKLLLKTQIQTQYILKIESLTSLDSDVIYAKSLWGLKLKKDSLTQRVKDISNSLCELENIKKQLQEIRKKKGKDVLIIMPDLS